MRSRSLRWLMIIDILALIMSTGTSDWRQLRHFPLNIMTRTSSTCSIRLFLFAELILPLCIKHLNIQIRSFWCFRRTWESRLIVESCSITSSMWLTWEMLHAAEAANPWYILIKLFPYGTFHSNIPKLCSFPRMSQISTIQFWQSELISTFG